MLPRKKCWGRLTIFKQHNLVVKDPQIISFLYILNGQIWRNPTHTHTYIYIYIVLVCTSVIYWQSDSNFLMYSSQLANLCGGPSSGVFLLLLHEPWKNRGPFRRKNFNGNPQWEFPSCFGIIYESCAFELAGNFFCELESLWFSLKECRWEGITCVLLSLNC